MSQPSAAAMELADMTIKTPLSDLIQTRMRELDLDPQALGLRLGYTNPIKAAGRVHALRDGHIGSAKSRAALRRLPEAIEVPSEVVERALAATAEILAALGRDAAEQQRLALERQDTAWRAAFRPHAVIQTERTVPSQIAICATTGGAERWLMIPFDLTRPPVTFVQQAVAALPKKLWLLPSGQRCVPFFSAPLGLIINYAPDRALRCDLDGTPLEALPGAYRLGHTSLLVGGRPVPAGVFVAAT